MIDEKRIEDNKNIFISLLRSIKRENAKIEDLIAFLEKSDFFVAPASTKYHGSYVGGLCEHSLNVYFNLVMLNALKGANLDEDSIKILALCHDFGKIGYYEKYIQNKKVYQDEGTLSDAGGKYEWVPTTAFRRMEKSLFVIGSHGERSEYITRCYLPLTLSEVSAIYNHHSGFDAPPSTNISEVYTRFPEALLLHIADCLSSHFDEK